MTEELNERVPRLRFPVLHVAGVQVAVEEVGSRARDFLPETGCSFHSVVSQNLNDKNRGVSFFVQNQVRS